MIKISIDFVVIQMIDEIKLSFGIFFLIVTWIEMNTFIQWVNTLSFYRLFFNNTGALRIFGNIRHLFFIDWKFSKIDMNCRAYARKLIDDFIEFYTKQIKVIILEDS